MADADADLAFAGVAGQGEALRNGAVTRRELIELSLRRIEHLNHSSTRSGVCSQRKPDATPRWRLGGFATAT